MIDLETLEKSPRNKLLREWQAHLEHAPPKSLSCSLMRRMLAFEGQARKMGGLDKETRRAIEKINKQSQEARASTHRNAASKLALGTRLLREWNGVTHQVEVVEDGYLWQGQRHKSLSAIAKAITGAHWSGPRFFGLNKSGDK